ncbi:MAG: HDIG domain-containing protein [Odoribacteraceae bacterium]|jgi:uncharacterized protein|nr:HDIG domain-containing protein [Odoribacteraceae bacterium]
MNPEKILLHYYNPTSRVFQILLEHSLQVREKATLLATRHPELSIDLPFAREAALLHDVGIFLTRAPGIDCHGEKPYVCHGYLGADLLRAEGLPRHALVCERHTGAGISIETIRAEKLPLPERDMIPRSIEEELVCFADKFFSKTRPGEEKTAEQVRAEIAPFGEEAAGRLEKWFRLFS